MILSGRVKLNGSVTHLGQKADLEKDILEVDARIVKIDNRPQSIYILLNKPRGVVSTCQDPEKRKTVIDLLPEHLKENTGIHPVGRLDIDSSGALLLTNDGQLTLGLTHPRYHVPKTYQVWISGQIDRDILKAWSQGIILNGKKTLPAEVKILKKIIDHTLLEIVLKEGRNRQIRKIADHFGLEVLKLHRTSIGEITLQSNREPLLTSGRYRLLTPTEIKYLKNTVNLASQQLVAPILEHCL
jgi:23S rRNA pseudouridine2605 synthase